MPQIWVRLTRRWMGGLAATAAAVAVPALLPGTTDRVFAAWTPVPAH